MKWIKYQIIQSQIDDEVILTNKKVGYNEHNLAIAEAEAYNGVYEIIEDEKTFESIEVLTKGNVVDNLESDSTDLPLSAKQGKLLNQGLISKPSIFYGTAEPSASLGKDGDLYFQYEE